MPFSLGSILAILVSFQLAFLATFLLSNKKGNRLSNSLLGTLFALISLNLADLSLQLIDEVQVPIWLGPLNDAFLFLFGPLIYVYTQSVIYSDFQWRRNHLLHCIPAALMLVIFALNLLLLDSPEHARYPREDIPLIFQIYDVMLYLHLFSYYFFSRRLLRQYRHTIRENYSDLSERNLNWLAFAIDNFGGMILFSLALTISSATGSETIITLSLFGILLFIFYFINRVIFKALRQPELFSGIPHIQSVKYASSKLGETEAGQIQRQLLQMMTEEQLYLNPDLSLAQLAQKLNCTPKTLSQVINQSIGKSFYDFVNEYRVEEAKRLLKNPSDPAMTIQEVMYDVGFSSKSSFNTVFKKKTGKTPTEFRKSENL